MKWNRRIMGILQRIVRLVWVGAVIGIWGSGVPTEMAAQTDRITTTPILLQQGFGRGGMHLPGDGMMYCGPTANASSILWMHLNGYDRLWDQPYDSVESNQENLIRSLAGLMGTNPRQGTYPGGTAEGLVTYLSLKGYANFEVGLYLVHDEGTREGMTLERINSYNTGYGFANISWGWYEDKGEGYQRAGGHVVTYLGSIGDDQIIIANPDPFVKGVNPEYLPVYRETEGTLSGGLLVDLSGVMPGTQVKAMVESIYYVVPNAGPDEVGGAVAWEITDDQEINTNGAYLTVEAPIYGTGKLSKLDFGSEDGMLVLTAGAGGEENPYTYSGGTLMQAGVLRGENATGTPFGTGSLELYGGELWVAPAGTGEDVVVYGATDPGAILSVGGSGALILNKGAHESLTFTVGSYTDGVTSNLELFAPGAFLIGTAAGFSELGVSERLLVAGEEGNLPELFHGIVAPWMIGVEVSNDYQGAFLSYQQEEGFVVAEVSHHDFENSASSDLVEVKLNQQITGTGRAYGVIVQNGVTLGGTEISDRLWVGDSAVQNTSTVILNGGTLSVPVLEFDPGSSGLIYVSGQGGRIESEIRVSGYLTIQGRGILEFIGESDYSGGTYVRSGILSVRNQTGSATGTGKVSVFRNGTLAGDGRIGGSVDTEGILVPGYLDGETLVPATLSIGGDLTMYENSIYRWMLGDLIDIHSGGVAGEDWGMVVVEGELIVRGLAYVELIFAEGMEPESGGAFWNENRFWGILSASSFTNPTNLSVFGKKFQYGSFYFEIQGDLLGLRYTPVPEPAYVVLFLGVLMGVVMIRRKQARQA